MDNSLQKSTMFEAQKLIEQEDHDAAIMLLNAAIGEDMNDADAFNLLGYASRKIGDLGAAAEYYATALGINPTHRGALEYQGELYLLLKRPEKAESNLDKLREICGESCEEYNDLAKDLAVYKSGG